MKRFLQALSVVSIFLIASPGSVRSFDAALCGATLASYGSPPVPARSNEGSPDESCGGRSTYGLQYQCVEYVRRFYHLVKGIETREGRMEKRWNGNADTYFKTASEKGLSAFPNGGPVPPRPDDILAFSGGPYGHVAIISAVTPDHIEFVEQNFSPTGTGRLAYHPLTRRVEDRISGGETFIVEGWLRPQTAPLLPPEGAAETISNRRSPPIPSLFKKP